MANKVTEDNEAVFYIPKVCQQLSLLGNEKIRNEHPEWLKDKGSIPFWSRLNPLSCTGQPRAFFKAIENSFQVELSGCLLSLFGTASQQTDCFNRMENMNHFHLMNNVFALCAALKIDFGEWSEKLMDMVISSAADQYSDLLKTQFITDKVVNINHFNGLFNFNGEQFKAQLQQVATGTLYIPFGLSQFNLARALTWFFNRYQFGFVKCGKRTLAIGNTLNNEYGFFMYDCQSSGYPLFEEQQRNSYILRTPYIQILLYCLLKTLDFTENVNFIVYNVDITIINLLERKVLKQRVYTPLTTMSSNNVVEKKASCTRKQNRIEKNAEKNAQKIERKNAQKISQTNSQKNLQNNTKKIAQKSVSSNRIARKQNVNNSSKTSKSETVDSHETNKQIILDPNKMYYIVAVPKKSRVTAQIEPKHLIIPQTDISKIEEDNRLEEELESIDLEKSASTVTLTPIKERVIKNSENLGLKVYLVDNSNSTDSSNFDSADQIKIAHQLRDFFLK